MSGRLGRRDQSRARRGSPLSPPPSSPGFAAASTPSTGRPASIQASSPPRSGRMRVKPCCLSFVATRAAEASFGHVQ
jgi:hypothetical protein